MSRFVAPSRFRPVFIIDRTPRKRRKSDGLGLTIVLAFIAAMSAYALATGAW